MDERNLQGLKALMLDQKVKKAIVVSLDKRQRKTETGVEIFHWKKFCEKLWNNEFI